MYRFLLSSRWLGWFLLVCLLAGVCGWLGNWQMERRSAVLADTAVVEGNYDAEPVPYAEAKQRFADYDPSAEWLPVRMTGTYDTANQRIVRNRPLNGQPGYEVVVPLRMADGSAVAINRGWLPIGNDEAGRPDTIPAPPAGEVTVVARVRPGEPTLDRGAPEGQLPSIDLGAYQQELDYPLEQGSYGVMAQEDPAPAEVPEAVGKPELDEGLHLSYGLQWYAFGALMFVGLGYAARQEALGRSGYVDEDDDDDGMFAANPLPVKRAPRRKRRGPTGEEEEDALLDAQGF